jgi:hypothetical protein
MARLTPGAGAATGEDGAGSYRHTTATGAREWSDAVYDILGFRPGAVVPSAVVPSAVVPSAELMLRLPGQAPLLRRVP